MLPFFVIKLFNSLAKSNPESDENPDSDDNQHKSIIGGDDINVIKKVAKKSPGDLPMKLYQAAKYQKESEDLLNDNEDEDENN